MVTTTRRRGINASAAIKVPCIAASTGNLTLEAEQTVDSIALVEGDRCFVKSQTDTTEIGIYKVATGTWVREPDFDGSYDVVEGTIVPVSRGTTNGDTYWKITNTGTITIGTTALTVQATTVLSSAILNDGSVKMIADFSPNVTDTYDLGTGALKWQDLHLNGAATVGGSIHMDDGIMLLDKGDDVASASGLTLGADGNYFDITGTTNIDTITTKGIGAVVRLHFDGALTLNYDASDLVLPGGASITTIAGDEATFIEYATGDWRCVDYQRNNTTIANHIRAGNTQLYRGTGTPITDLSDLINVLSIAEDTWETVGPTGSGADHIWATMDQLPSSATMIILGVRLGIRASAAAQVSLGMYGAEGDVVAPSLSTENIKSAYIFDASGSGDDRFITDEFIMPLGPTNQDFQVAWSETSTTTASDSIKLYYHGFITD